MAAAGIELQKRFDERCKRCFLRTYHHLFEKFGVEAQSRQTFISFFHEEMDRCQHLSSPEIQLIMNHEFCRLIGVDDPFAEEKSHSNGIALDLYEQWKPVVMASGDPFDRAVRLALAGNIMDYGASNGFDIQHTLDRVLHTPLAIDHTHRLRRALAEAKKILYLGDNAGEIVFDRLFIETIGHPDLTYAVKGAPVLNDATLADAEEAGMNLAADVITNGYGAPSTVLEHCSREFLSVYRLADLIISKGQGNLEGLMQENDPRIFFLLMAKCDVIAELLQVEKGSFIVCNMN